VQALPLIVSLMLGALFAPSMMAALADGRLARVNYRGRKLACPSGLLVVLAAVCALVPLALAQRLGNTGILEPELSWIALYVLGVALLGLADDALADEARGWRGHVGSLRRGRFSTGALKAVGSAGLALYVMSQRGLSTGEYLTGALLLLLATNAFNLLDLRPGRAGKALLVLGAALTLATGDFRAVWALGLFVGPVMVVGYYDVRELAMLGDTGSNLLGAVAGAWLVMTLSLAAQLVAVGVLLLLTAYGEFRSISDLIERTPGLRELDSFGRPRDAS
jgi:UDP-N-acetylmuramyl pentapeptide phosphotransferase/UDP-N-acetylglucosamine-1-phosphate transferase